MASAEPATPAWGARAARIAAPVCPILDGTQTRRMVLPGGHHFGGDYGSITDRILAEAGLAAQPPIGAP